MKPSVNCVAFISPNKAPMIGDLLECFREKTLKEMQVQDPHFNKDQDHLVEMWFVGAGSDNMRCHGFEHEGQVYNAPFYVSESLLRGKHEGDVVNVHTEDIDYEVTLKQQGYKHQRYGLFEEVLEKVCH